MNGQMKNQLEFQYVPLALLRESKTNPRRQENAPAFKELTESVRDRGVLVPLLARPVDGKLEIVAGSRRYRAAREAGLQTVPVFVHTMTDGAALEIQIIENLQREDVHPLDEGLGYRTLMEKSKLDVSAIAKKVGKSASYIYQRMKLADLDKSVQKATLEKRISAGHAILIARLQPKEQSEALKYCRARYNGEIVSVRELAGWIQRELHLDLNSAAFKKDDAELLPAAGPCTTCPKRAGNNPELFKGLKGDTCTDRTCYQAKMTSYIGRKRTELVDAGEKVVSISSDYVPGPEKKGAPLSYDKWTEAKKGSCSSVRKGINLAAGARHGQVLNVCANPSCKIHFGRGAGSSAQTKPSPTEIRRREQEEVKRTVRRRLFKAVVDKAPAKFGRKDLELVAEALLREIWHDYRKQLIKMLGWTENKKGGPRGLDYERIGAAKIPKLPTRGLGQFILAMALVRDLEVNEWGEGGKALRATAKRYRVDEAKITRTAKLELDARRKIRAKADREKKRQAAEKAAGKLVHKLHPKKKAQKTGKGKAKPVNKKPAARPRKKKPAKAKKR